MSLHSGEGRCLGAASGPHSARVGEGMSTVEEVERVKMVEEVEDIEEVEEVEEVGEVKV